MIKFAFLRKPMKLVFVALLAALLSTAMLVFCLQAYFDGMVMEHSMNSTAYVGTLYSRRQAYPMLKEIPANILQQLEHSDTVDKIMIAPVYSARAEGLTHVADGFGNLENLNAKLFLEGTVDSKPSLSPGGFGMIETLLLRISVNWGGCWSANGIEVRILRDAGAKAPSLKEGDHVFLVGRYNSNPNGDVNGMLLFDPEMLDSLGQRTDSAIWNHSILVLPENLSEEESHAQIQWFLQETGLVESCSLMSQIKDMFTVHQVEDMSMLLTVADGTTFITQGRELQAKDTGRPVCVIHEAVAAQNSLTVGDTISLSIADGCYTYDSDFEEYLGEKSGYPFEGDTLLSYKAYGEFEIVGLYSEISRNIGGADYGHHTRNDIFVPSGLLPDSAAGAQARCVTFRVLGPEYEDFMNEFEVSLNDQGYSFRTIDTGWEAMSSSFYAMNDRRILMAVCAVVSFLAAVLSYDVLLSNHFRYEFALRRLLGAYPKEAREVYTFGFLVTALPSALVSVGCSFGVYRLWLRELAAAALPVALPSDGTILANLAGWSCAEFLAAFAGLMVLSVITNKQSLIQLLK